MQIHYLLSLFTLLVFPKAFANAVSAPRNLNDLLGIFSGIIDLLIPLIFALTFFTIAWGVIRAWIMGDATSEDLERGKKIAFVGIIALVVMSAIWGILKLLQRSFFG